MNSNGRRNGPRSISLDLISGMAPIQTVEPSLCTKMRSATKADIPAKACVRLLRGVAATRMYVLSPVCVELLSNGSQDMPPLMSASDSSEDGGKYDSESEHQRSEGDAESDYDADEDELLQEMLQEALDAVIDMDDFLEQPDIKKSSNPFTRMLSNLKGQLKRVLSDIFLNFLADRYFSANPTLKANEQSRRPFKPRPENVTSSPAVPRPATKATTQTNQDCHRDLPSLESTGPLQPEAKPAQTKTGLRTTSLKLESGEEKRM